MPRKQSAETQLRTLKREFKAFQEAAASQKREMHKDILTWKLEADTWKQAYQELVKRIMGSGESNGAT